MRYPEKIREWSLLRVQEGEWLSNVLVLFAVKKEAESPVRKEGQVTRKI